MTSPMVPWPEPIKDGTYIEGGGHDWDGCWACQDYERAMKEVALARLRGVAEALRDPILHHEDCSMSEPVHEPICTCRISAVLALIGELPTMAKGEE